MGERKKMSGVDTSDLTPFDMTVEQADKERRLGRIVFKWGDIKDKPVLLISSIFGMFFPIDIHPMGGDAYVYIGFSPLFDSLVEEGKEFAFEDIPFYMLEMDDAGQITAIRLKIEKDLIKKPTAKEIKELG